MEEGRDEEDGDDGEVGYVEKESRLRLDEHIGNEGGKLVYV